MLKKTVLIKKTKFREEEREREAKEGREGRGGRAKGVEREEREIKGRMKKETTKRGKKR